MEHEDIQAMFRQLVWSEFIDRGVWEEKFQDMMQTARVHFITEERELLRSWTDHAMRKCRRVRMHSVGT